MVYAQKSICIRQTDAFSGWLARLRDPTAVARVMTRLDRVAAGQFGDVRSVGQGVSELRIHCGPGYRVYYTRRGDTVVLLLCGGDKASQRRDIARAHRLARELGD
ncbi:MAG: type II toxin-antitoxin system RelE/ParE family toxin [Pseudomonadota bacterium]